MLSSTCLSAFYTSSISVFTFYSCHQSFSRFPFSFWNSHCFVCWIEARHPTHRCIMSIRPVISFLERIFACNAVFFRFLSQIFVVGIILSGKKLPWWVQPNRNLWWICLICFSHSICPDIIPRTPKSMIHFKWAPISAQPVMQFGPGSTRQKNPVQRNAHEKWTQLTKKTQRQSTTPKCFAISTIYPDQTTQFQQIV